MQTISANNTHLIFDCQKSRIPFCIKIFEFVNGSYSFVNTNLLKYIDFDCFSCDRVENGLHYFVPESRYYTKLIGYDSYYNDIGNVGDSKDYAATLERTGEAVAVNNAGFIKSSIKFPFQIHNTSILYVKHNYYIEFLKKVRLKVPVYGGIGNNLYLIASASKLYNVPVYAIQSKGGEYGHESRIVETDKDIPSNISSIFPEFDLDNPEDYLLQDCKNIRHWGLERWWPIRIQDYQFNDKIIKHCDEYLNCGFNADNSISVHIRCRDEGDFWDPVITNFDWIINVIKRINTSIDAGSKHPDVVLFTNKYESKVYTDFKEKCASECPDNAVVDSPGKNDPHIVDFYLMSKCKYNIVNVSEFSACAAWFNVVPSNVYIHHRYNKYFMVGGKLHSKNYIPPEWNIVKE